MIDTTTGPRTLWEKTYDGHEFRITAYPTSRGMYTFDTYCSCSGHIKGFTAYAPPGDRLELEFRALLREHIQEVEKAAKQRKAEQKAIDTANRLGFV